MMKAFPLAKMESSSTQISSKFCSHYDIYSLYMDSSNMHANQVSNPGPRICRNETWSLWDKCIIAQLLCDAQLSPCSFLEPYIGAVIGHHGCAVSAHGDGGSDCGSDFLEECRRLLGTGGACLNAGGAGPGIFCMHGSQFIGIS